MKRILFVCYGNICRSPMAEMIFKDFVNKANLKEEFFVDSAGTSDEESRYHSPIHKGTRGVLIKNKIPFSEHVARQFSVEDYDYFDYIICMEKYNIDGLMQIIGNDKDKKIYRLLDFSSNPKDVDDPWYHHDFDKTFDEIYEGCKSLFEYLTNKKV